MNALVRTAVGTRPPSAALAAPLFATVLCSDVKYACRYTAVFAPTGAPLRPRGPGRGDSVTSYVDFEGVGRDLPFPHTAHPPQLHHMRRRTRRLTSDTLHWPTIGARPTRRRLRAWAR